MRGIAAVVALAVLTLLLRVISAGASLEVRATLALGVLLLAAALAGAAAQAVRLPRVGGYLLAGLALSAVSPRFIRPDEIAALAVVLDAAVALIAVAIGAELRLTFLRSHAHTLLRATAATLVAPLILVALFVVALGKWFPITVHQPFGDRVAVALVLGGLAAASSPLVTKAVIDEMRATGLFARVTLAVAALKDATVLLVVALALGVAALIGSPGSLQPDAPWRPLLVFAGSIALGLAAGATTAAFVRRVRHHAPAVLLVLGFGAAHAAALMGLEVLVVGLAAGWYLGNSLPAGEGVLRALQRGAVPLYAVGFVLAGTGLRLDLFATVWPWVLALGVLRAFGFHYGLVWAARDVGTSPQLARNGWVGIMGQGGVAIGLASLARRAFPEWGVSLEAFVLGMIGVHEIIGPVLWRWALRQTGPGREREGERSAASNPATRLAVVSGSGVQ